MSSLSGGDRSKQEETKCPNSSSRNIDFGNTWVDQCLDWLRNHRPPAYIDAPLAYFVAFLCLCYKAYCYIQLRHSCWNNSKPQQRVPLVTACQNRDVPREELAVLHAKLMAELFRDPGCKTQAKLVEKIRSSLELRRLLNSFMMDQEKYAQREFPQLCDAIDAIWDEVLQLPSFSTESVPSQRSFLFRSTTTDDDTRNGNENGQKSAGTSADKEWFALSLIIPAYRESGRQLQRTLQHALDRSQRPDRVEVIVVDCGQCAFLERLHSPASLQRFGKLEIVRLSNDQKGRGPALNYGARHASGSILTFLHSDTLVPPDWDTKIVVALDSDRARGIIQACVFSIGHDTSEQGLDGRPHPYGLRSVWLLANLRSYFFRLPYGDHVISMPRVYFEYIGGYPDQPIMEDYDLMQLLRQRAVYSATSSARHSGNRRRPTPEDIRIIPPPTCHCSVRRWQTCGVAYTTMVNTLIVHRYQQGWTADEIYQYYYQRSTSKGNAKKCAGSNKDE